MIAGNFIQHFLQALKRSSALFLVLVTGIFVFCEKLSGQNLIYNPGFEILLKPVKSKFPGNIEQALPWFPAGIGSPDLIRRGEDFHGKATAASGENYAGIILYDGDNKDFREYLEIKLTQTLVKNTEYCLRFSVSAAAKSFAFTDELGILLTADSVLSSDWNTIQHEPTFTTQKYAAISDTGSWKKLEFKFKANGTEQFLTIGNFRTDNATSIQINDKYAFLKLAYLYIDDIYLGPCNPVADPVIGQQPIFAPAPVIESGKLRVPNVVTPNGDGFNDSFTIPGLPKYAELTITHKDGSVILRSTNYTNDWDGAGVMPGKYRYELKLPDGNLISGSVDLVRK